LKALYTGGMKSGKSRLAEAKTLELSPAQKPYYLATSEALDDEMRERIERHKAQRAENFMSIESPTALFETISHLDGTVLVECLSIWINNMLHYGKNEADIMEELHKILALDKNIVFVINEVGSGIIPDNALAREFIDISGRASQIVAAACDEVYLCAVGLALRMK
jgi:adenosylcobinamide kinase / adenosylcobinamide-phosphate guanylyltransferase